MRNLLRFSRSYSSDTSTEALQVVFSLGDDASGIIVVSILNSVEEEN